MHPHPLPCHPVRDELQALLVLELAEAQASESGFAAHALCRLAAGDELYGNRSAQLDLSRLIGELSERAADLGAWGAVSLQALDREIEEGPGRQLIESALHASISMGALAYQALMLARNHLPQEGGAS
jgi:hypothetical protein